MLPSRSLRSPADVALTPTMASPTRLLETAPTARSSRSTGSRRSVTTYVLRWHLTSQLACSYCMCFFRCSRARTRRRSTPTFTTSRTVHRTISSRTHTPTAFPLLARTRPSSPRLTLAMDRHKPPRDLHPRLTVPLIRTRSARLQAPSAYLRHQALLVLLRQLRLPSPTLVLPNQSPPRSLSAQS